MQFHLNGFRPGNPEISEPAEPYNASRPSDALPEEVDVLIVGCGPAGLTLAAQLAAFPDIKTRIVDQKSGPLVLGPGRRHRLPHDGDVRGVRLQRARAERGLLGQRDVVLEARRNQASATSSAAAGSRIPKTGCREFPHVILNQARVHDFYLDVMRNSPTRLEPDYSRRLLDLTIAPSSGDERSVRPTR